VLTFQGFVYLRDGNWPSSSLYDVASFNLPEFTAAAIHQPQLSSMRDVHRNLSDASAADRAIDTALLREYYARAANQRRVPRTLVTVQQWLIAPTSWFGFHRLLIWILRNLSIAGLLAVCSFLLLCLAAVISPSSEDWDRAIRRAAG
jgi:hypothetical protein